MFSKTAIFAFLTACALISGAAWADDAAPVPPGKCVLSELASLSLTLGESKAAPPTVPVSLGNSPASFVVGLAQPFTAVSKAIADANKIQTQAIGSRNVFPFLMYAGHVTDATGVASVLTIGHATVPNVQMLVFSAKDPDGVLGLDVLSHMDVELNLKAGRLNLFSQDHCADQAVYWGRPFVVLPMTLDDQGVPVFQMQLDGKAVTAKLDITKNDATMGRDRAEALFGITPQTPGLKPRSDVDIITVTRGNQRHVPDDATKSYEYAFKSLSVNGIEIHNLSTLLMAQPFPDACQGNSRRQVLVMNADQCNSGVDLILGRKELRGMRLFFAFKEKKLYITAADPDPATAKEATH